MKRNDYGIKIVNIWHFYEIRWENLVLIHYILNHSFKDFIHFYFWISWNSFLSYSCLSYDLNSFCHMPVWPLSHSDLEILTLFPTLLLWTIII